MSGVRGIDPQVEAGQRRCGTLLVLSGPHTGRALRAAPNGVLHLGAATLRAGGPLGVAAAHASVQGREGSFWLRDLGSEAGTWLGGQRLARGMEARLRPGDRIRLGPRFALRFDMHSEEEHRVLRELYESVLRDPLTGCFNRRYLEDRLDREVSHARRHGAAFAALMVDVDHFRRVNDRHGHPTGDRALRALAAAMARLLRPEDVLARYGGEEFCVLARQTDAKNARILGERLRAAVAALCLRTADAERLAVTVSVGTAALRARERGAALIARADEALYRAKARGRDRVVAAR